MISSARPRLEIGEAALRLEELRRGRGDLVPGAAPARRNLLGDADHRADDLVPYLAAALADVIGHSGSDRQDLLADLAAACGDLVRHEMRGLREPVARLAAAADDLLGDTVACADEFLAKGRRARDEAVGDGGAGACQPLGQLRAAGDEAFFQILRGTFEALAHLVSLPGEGIHHVGAGLRQRARDLDRALAQRPGKEFPGALEGGGHVLGLALEGGRKPQSGFLDAALDRLARTGKLPDQLGAAHRHIGDDPLARLGEGGADQHAALVEGGRDALAGGRHGVDDAPSGRFQLGREILVRARDSCTHAVRIRDDRLALCDELVDKRADADLVIGIGALERRDLAAHQRLELARPRERPFDAVAHRGDLAPDRLRHRCNGIGRIRLGLCEPDSNLAEGAREELHLLRAHGEHCGDVEQDHRTEEGNHPDQHLNRRQTGEEGFVTALDPCRDEGRNSAEPDRRGKRRKDVGAARGASLQGLEQDADVAAIVVGDGGAIRGDDAARGRKGCGCRGGLLRYRFGRLVWSEPSRRSRALRREPRVGDVGQAGFRGFRTSRVPPGRRHAQRLLDRRQRSLGRVLELWFGRHGPPR